MQVKFEGGMNNSHLKHYDFSLVIMHRKEEEFRKTARKVSLLMAGRWDS